MRLHQFLTKLFRARDSRGKHSRPATKRSRRLFLEPLEDRRLLATYQFADATFSDTDWSASIVSSTGGPSESAQQLLTGGNPGAYRDMTHTEPSPSSIGVAHVYLPGVYDPSVSGAITSLDYTEDQIEFAPPFPGAAIGAEPMLIQGGVYYFGVDITFSSTAWQSVQLTGLTAGDFSSVSATHPDFSTSGGPMQFGFARSNSNNPGNPTIQTHHGIDNWMFTLHTQSAPSIFTVTNTNDSGPGSLRQAILDAENTTNVGGPDEIHFNIPGSGVHTIFPTHTFGFADGLPQIIDPVIIDGYTQPEASPNTLAVGDDAVLKIEIDGSNLPGTKLFIFSGANSTVRGLAITHVPDAALALGSYGYLHANHNTIVGNFFGTDAGGLTYQGGTGPAINITAGSNNVIGGPDPADRNVIAPGSFVPTASITMQSGTGNVIQGNYIGVNKDGTVPLQSPSGGFAIDISADSGGNIIGGATPGDGNVIFATTTAIRLTQGNTGHNVVQGNLLGTNATGTAGLGGYTYGLDIQGSSDTVAGNVISGGTFGILIDPQGTAAAGPGPTIQGNKIGTDITGASAIPNSGDGIVVLSGNANGATIGGTGLGEGNTIAFNGRYGVFINQGTGWSILGNSIFANGNIGINLNGAPDGFFGPVTRNDAGDGDGDANGLQNYPIITSAISGGSNTIVIGTLNSTPGASFRIEFFASDAADSSGFGEGQVFLGAITTNATDDNGDVSFAATLPVALSVGQVVSATATDQFGNTSEFALTIAGQVTNTSPVITSLDGPTSGLTGEQLSYTGDFNDPNPDTWTSTVNYGDGSGDQSLALNPDKTFAFDHVFSSPGTFTVTVTVADNHGNLDSDSLTVTVTTNTPPVITRFDGDATGLVDQTLLFSGAFDDPDLDTWTGTLNFGDGTSDLPFFPINKQFLAIHSYASVGTYTVTLTIADNHGNSDTRSVTTTITGASNTPPHAVADAVSLTTGTSRTINVLANDSDPDGNTLTVTSVTQPASGHGQVTINANGTLTYLQRVFVNGTETFTYTISDGHGGTSTAMVTVTVNLPARIGINLLLDQITSSGLSRGLQISLRAKLNAAQQSLAKGNSQAATGQLNALTNEIRALKHAHILAANVADLWLFEVQNILAGAGLRPEISRFRGVSPTIKK